MIDSHVGFSATWGMPINLSETVTVPKHYSMKRDLRLGTFQAAPGHTLERKEPVRRMRKAGVDRTGGMLGGVKGGPAYLAIIDNCVEQMKRVEQMPDVGMDEGGGIGRFVKYSDGNVPPRVLADTYSRDKRWAFVPMLGGYLRLAPEPKSGDSALLSFRPGEFVGEGGRSRIAGFASVAHSGFSSDRIRVRLPDDYDQWLPKRAGAAERAGVVRPVPAPPTRDGLVAEIRKLFEVAGEDASETLAWAETAELAEVERWVAEAKGGAK
jgi:hypothetical protein